MASDIITMENNVLENNVAPSTSIPSTTSTTRIRKILGKSGTAIKDPQATDSQIATDDDYSFLAAVSIF